MPPKKQKKPTHTKPFTILVGINAHGDIRTSDVIVHNPKPPSDETLRSEASDMLYDLDGGPGELISLFRYDFPAHKLPAHVMPVAAQASSFRRFDREMVFVDRTTDEGKKMLAKQEKAFAADRKAAKPKKSR